MSSQSWDTDKESKAKLQSLQSVASNKQCADCSAPSPQWASPKFGTFICLTCAGLHRGLGVHISFVRSIAMDAFKPAEVSRMDKGGNARWHKFYQDKTKAKWSYPGKGADQAAKARLEEIYAGDVGEEYKERLACEVEGRDFTGVPKKASPSKARQTDGGSGSGSNGFGAAGGPGNGSGSGGIASRTQKQQNEDFFARKGEANASRPSGVKPSEGGRYEGFGSSPAPGGGAGSQGGARPDGTMPGVDDFQRDPMAALSKGFGWFSSQVSKNAKSVNEGWIQPTAQKIAEADLATQARASAASASKAIQTGTRGAAERFNNFIEGEGEHGGGGGGSGGTRPEKADFWDSFGQPASNGSADSTLGTAAMRKSGDGGTGAGASKGKEDWGKDW